MMEHNDSTNSESGPERKSNFRLWALGVGITSLVVLMCGGVIGYFVYAQIRDNLEEAGLTQLTAPIFDVDPVPNQIAYIGNDDNVWVSSPDGKEQHSLTSDSRGYSFPTWSPDSRRVAFIGPGTRNRPTLYVSPAAEATPSELYNASQSAPFYLYWAPDSQSITFLTQEATGLAMRQASPRHPENQRLLEEGSPFYWVWSPTSEKLLMHVGGARDTSDSAHISILDNNQEAHRVELNLAPGEFQAPVWTMDGSAFFYIATDEEGLTSIFKTDAQTLAQTHITNVGGFAYIVLAPGDKHIAYLQIERGNRPPFGTAYIVDTEGNNHHKLTDRPVGSMYWSPDGSKLALLTFAQSDDGSTAKVGGLAAPLSQEVVLRWWIYDVASESLEPLISFNPTPEFLQTIPYFDQYHLSLTFWSPDSRYFVITKENSNGQGGVVTVVDTSGKEQPRQIGKGTMAVWSWQ